MPQFENCISLGWYCGTAATLGRLGLRSFSGPFDWYNSDLQPIISLIDNEFADFFEKENLVEVPDWKKTFRDEKYGFLCFHDIRRSLEEDYPEIHEKYKRRAEKFLEAMHSPTCLFRAVRSEKEIEYILGSREHIDEVIKRYNDKNNIIYLFDKKLKREQFRCDYYNLDSDWSYDPYLIRTLFDRNKELLDFCSSIMPFERVEENRKYYYSLNSACAGEIYKMITDKVDSVLQSITDGFGGSLNDGIYLWGYGKHGKALYKYLQEHSINVSGIVDEDYDRLASENEKIISAKELPRGSKVFISIEKDAANEGIIRFLKSMDCSYLTYKDIYRTVR